MNNSLEIRKSKDRGYFDHGWLKTYHTFSFGHYYDPKFMGFRTLRVINEDTVAPGQGFPTHSHSNMEIITVVIDGELAHRDSMNNEKIIREQEIQAMSAGIGVQHSEYNPSESKASHFLQIWIIPDTEGTSPRYHQTRLPEIKNEFTLLASKEGKDHSLKIQQDVNIYMLSLEAGTSLSKALGEDRYGWIQLISGTLDLNGERLEAGDGAKLNAGTAVTLKAVTPTKLLFFDLN